MGAACSGRSARLLLGSFGSSSARLSRSALTAGTSVSTDGIGTVGGEDVAGLVIEGGGFRSVVDVVEVEVDDIDDVAGGGVVGGLVGSGTVGDAPLLPLQAE